jgi:hypothetical protein|nr:MAG TPA: hypothetical protein [Caudoviricetes sp.]
MTKLQEAKDEAIKQLYNNAYKWYIWGVRNDYIEVMFREALDYSSADSFKRWTFEVAIDSFKHILEGFWQEDEQLFIVDLNKFLSVSNYYNIMTRSVDDVIEDKDFEEYFYSKHPDIVEAMNGYKEISND